MPPQFAPSHSSRSPARRRRVVSAHIAERHAPALKSTVVAPREQVAAQAPRFDFDLADFFK